MTGIISRPRQPTPQPTLPPPTTEDPAVEEARRRERLIQQRQRGAQANILTGPTGVTGGKRLLGE